MRFLVIMTSFDKERIDMPYQIFLYEEQTFPAAHGPFSATKQTFAWEKCEQ